MGRSISYKLFFILIALILSLNFTTSVLSAPKIKYIEGDVLITFKSDISGDQIKEFEISYQLTLISKISHLRLHHYHHQGNIQTKKLMQELQKLDIINSVDFNQINHTQYTPTDPSFNEQWYLHNTGQQVNGLSGPSNIDIDWPEAMDIFSGIGDVIVAVIDSGVTLDHPDISSKLWVNTAETDNNSIDDDGNGYVDDIYGWDFIGNDNLPIDSSGHGTLVSSIIAASIDNGLGVAGISQNVQIMPLLVCNNNGTCSSLDFINASTYAAENGAKIINYSAGGYNYNSSELAQIQWLEQQGILLIISSGNDGNDTDITFHYPSG